MNETVYLNRAEILDLSARVDLEGALRRVLVEAYRGEAGQAVRSELMPEGLGAVLGLMPAYRRRAPATFGAKVVCVIPSNPSRGLPAHSGIVTLFDATDGRLRALADAGAVTEVRTAALTALATATIVGDRPGVSLVIGAGHQGLGHLRALAGQGRPLQVWARRPEQAAAAALTLASEGIEVAVAPDLEAAVREATVVTSVTGTPQPIIADEWLQPGVHLNAIGSSTPRVTEVPALTLRSATLYVDDVAAVTQLSGELRQLAAPLPELTPIGAVLAGDVEVESRPGARTVYKSVGVPLQDLALVDALAERAEAESIGQRVRL